ncbi:MAG: hypothetical protein RL497_2667, partial [Pseudomonadota bacterium]
MLTTAFRPAQAKDCRWLWQLRQHPSVAAQSLNAEPIPYRQHCRWYTQLLKDPQRQLSIFFLAESNSNLGYIRAEPYADDYLLSWAIDPELHGQGFGKHMLRTWCEVNPRTLWAQIKPTNVA